MKSSLAILEDQITIGSVAKATKTSGEAGAGGLTALWSQDVLHGSNTLHQIPNPIEPSCSER